ncbi:MAG: type II toxin-antitoxin system PemK/MazF family toxin [Acidobacteria bacterium]|nr:type II toxin-antitoxin system PemK/MazF family toxin [Acidobacteriota bacterium]
MRRGEIWWASGEEGRRPVLVLTRDSAIPLLTRVTVVPATTTARGIPTEVALGRADGMPRDCVLSADNLRTIAKSRLRGRVTALSAARLEEVCEALAFALGC